MVNRILTLTMGGKERILLFGVNGYINYIREITKKDPFEWLSKLDSLREGDEKQFIEMVVEDVAVMAYAGINSYLDSKDELNIPYDKVVKWCNGLNIEESALILRNAWGTITTDQPGEQNSQPVNGSEVKALV